MSAVTVAVTTLPHAQNMALPAYATEHAAGMDLCAAVANDVTLQPGQRTIDTDGDIDRVTRRI